MAPEDRHGRSRRMAWWIGGLALSVMVAYIALWAGWGGLR